MTATINLNYNQVLSIVMQMPFSERKKLSDELNSCCSKEFQPYTMAEINSRIDEAESDISNGKVISAEEGHRMLEQKYPWLCD